MAWLHVHTLEDECPGYIGGTTYDFRVHQVAKAYGTSTDGGYYGHVVQYVHQVQLHTTAIKHYGKHQAQCAAMRCKTLITRKVPFAIGKLAYRQEHLHRMGKEILRFVEKAMAESCTYEYAEEAIDEHWFKLVLAQLLLLEQIVHQLVHGKKTYAP